MANIELQGVTFFYADAETPALSGLNLSIGDGEFVVLGGATGSGKSTLLRLLKREVSPGGRLSGAILLGGRKIEDWPDREAASTVGLVMQHPDNQLVVDTVEHELAFGMENFGLDRRVMRRRMAEIAGFFGLEPLLSRRTDQLSGGQKQTVNLASVLMLQPRILLLDEPLAQLDPLAARELLGMIKRLNEEWGITVIMSEHRTDDLMTVADRTIRLDNGSITFDGTPKQFAAEAWNTGNPQWIGALPSVTRWAMRNMLPAAGDVTLDLPLSVKEARRLPAVECGNRASASPVFVRTESKPLLEAEGIFFAYDKKSPAVIRGLEWKIRQGDRIALFGGNGSGKSTLLQLLSGLRQPQRGETRLEGAKLMSIPAQTRYMRIGYLAQNPLLHFAHETLREDLTMAASRIGSPDPAREVRNAAERFGLLDLLHRHPHDLSGGERQLGALAITLLGRPQLLLLDEPTKGIDTYAKTRLTGFLLEAGEAGTAMVMATHDVEFAAGFANRCSLLFQGEIVADDEPEAFFQGNLFYATAVHRMLHGRGSAATSKEAVFR